MVEPENSLTLDMDARARAADALSKDLDGGFTGHFCVEYDEGDGCRICWQIAADVIRAAEGLQECSRCKGMGDVDGGGASSCCPECGGNGLESLAPLNQTQRDGQR